MKVILVIHAMALLLASISFANVKTVIPKNDEIIEVKAALGIATLIEFPDPIQQAVIGDQSAYRIEYSGSGATIKPLRSFAKTNVYFFTQKKRYNLRLTVVPQNQSFYILYIKNPEVGSGPRWTALNRISNGKDSQLKLLRMGSTQDGFILLDLEVLPKKSFKIQASDFWIKQGAESKAINSLFLSRTDARAKQSVLVGVAIQKSELQGKPLTLEFKRFNETLSLEVPKEVLWK